MRRAKAARARRKNIAGDKANAVIAYGAKGREIFPGPFFIGASCLSNCSEVEGGPSFMRRLPLVGSAHCLA